jgi:hypothetical protein
MHVENAPSFLQGSRGTLRQFVQFPFAALALPKLDEKKAKKLSTDDDLRQVLGLYKSDYQTALRVVLV